MRLQPLGHLSCAEYQGSKNDSLANPARDFGSRLRYGETRLNIISEADQLAAGCAITVDVGFFLLEIPKSHDQEIRNMDAGFEHALLRPE